MRLGTFLAAGRSLVGLKGVDGRYQLPQGRALPEFGAGKPAASSAATAKKEGAEVSVPESVLKSGLQEPTAGLEARPAPSAPVAAGSVRRVLRNLDFRRWFRPGKKTAAVPVFTNQPVQTELSLDNIKVVRNDLFDGDLELVPSRPKESLWKAGPATSVSGGSNASHKPAEKQTLNDLMRG